MMTNRWPDDAASRVTRTGRAAATERADAAQAPADFQTMRRVFDVTCAAVGCCVLLPLMAVLSLLIRATLGRPVFFTQTRVGLASEPFTLFKFRTMTEARGADGGLLPDEQRLTGLGRFLRRSRLDELPELFNILRGEMSFIGPRPLPATDSVAFGRLGRERCAVRPGLTGWAQVNGNASLTDEDKLALDLWYIERRSLGLDLVIVLKTVEVMLFGENVDENNINRARCHAFDSRRRR